MGVQMTLAWLPPNAGEGWQPNPANLEPVDDPPADFDDEDAYSWYLWACP